MGTTKERKRLGENEKRLVELAFASVRKPLSRHVSRWPQVDIEGLFGLRLVESISRWDAEKSSLRTWARCLLEYTVLDALRLRFGRRENESKKLLRATQLKEHADPRSQLPFSHCDGEDHFVYLLSFLTPRQRQVAEMMWRDGMSGEGVAEKLGIKTNTAFRHQHDSLVTLRKRLGVAP